MDAELFAELFKVSDRYILRFKFLDPDRLMSFVTRLSDRKPVLTLNKKEVRWVIEIFWENLAMVEDAEI